MSWFTVTVLLVVGSCNWTPAGGQTSCSLSGGKIKLLRVLCLLHFISTVTSLQTVAQMKTHSDLISSFTVTGQQPCFNA